MTPREAAFALTALFFTPILKLAEFVALPTLYRPDLLLVLTAVISRSLHPWAAAPVGFAVGLIEDLLVGRALGVRAVSLALAGVVSSLLKSVLDPDSAFSKVLCAAAAAFSADAASFGMLRIRGTAVGVVYLLKWVLPGTLLWAAALAVPMGAVAERLARGIVRIWPSSDGGQKGVTA